MTANEKATVEIKDWKPMEKKTLRGFFTIVLPSGLIIHDAMLHEKGENRWIALPAREYTDKDGNRQFARFLEFTSRTKSDRFRDQVLAALDQYFAEHHQ